MTTSSKSGSALNPKLVRELAEILRETELTEIEVEKGDLRLRVARTVQAAPVIPIGEPASEEQPSPSKPSPGLHEPKVERRDGGTLEVSVYAHDADHAPLVEAAVRQALSAARPATRSPSTLGPSTSGERPLQKLFSSGPSLGPIAPPRSTDQS